MTLPEKCPCQTISLIFWNINELHRYIESQSWMPQFLEEGPVCFGCAFLWQKHLFSAPQGMGKVGAISSHAGVTT